MRSNFMTTPGVWLRTPRVSQTEADYANAWEHAANLDKYARPWERWTLIGFVIFLACLFVAWLP